MTDAGEAAPGRAVWRIGGADRIAFLQGIVSADVRALARGPAYAAILTPQGKYLADFLMVGADEAIWIDIDAAIAEPTMRRLMLYRLRADVTIEPAARHVVRGLGATPPDGWADPRHPALGWRALRAAPGPEARIDWDAIRVRHGIPETGIELTPETYILEAAFERLHGVDFRKGCYVGQEVTARMKHKAELKKGLVRLAISGTAPPGTPILREGREVGTLGTVAGDRALAFARFDRVGPGMEAGTARLEPEPDSGALGVFD
ncbi:MAG: folate-binding protein YgfZ [Alphaproteobacteria bacterium]|nr:folate-binding protein YgfZ [Alphaproteobacteria bacterium]